MSKWHSTAISFKCYYLTENIARLINSNYHQQLKAHQVCLYWLFVFNCEHKHVFYSILMQMDRCWHIQHFTVMLKITVFTIPACCNKQQQSKSPQSNRVKKEQRLKKNHSHGGCHLQRQSNYVTHGNQPVCVCGKACVMRNCSISKKKRNKWMDIFICKGENTVDRLPFKEGMHSCWNILGLRI